MSVNSACWTHLYVFFLTSWSVFILISKFNTKKWLDYMIINPVTTVIPSTRFRCFQLDIMSIIGGRVHTNVRLWPHECLFPHLSFPFPSPLLLWCSVPIPAVQAFWRPGCLSWCSWASSLQWPWPSTSGDPVTKDKDIVNLPVWNNKGRGHRGVEQKSLRR